MTAPGLPCPASPPASRAARARGAARAGGAALLPLLAACTSPLRAAVGPTVDSAGRVGVEARAGVGVGLGSPRGAFVEELSVGGGYGLGLGRYLVLAASLGYHDMFSRRLGLRVAGSGGGAITSADTGLVGGGAAFGLQGRIHNEFGHLLLLGGDVRVDLLRQDGGATLVAVSLPLTLELRLQYPRGHWCEERVTPWFRLRTGEARSVVPHVIFVGALYDEAWTRHRGRWVLVAEEGPEGPRGRRRLSARPDGAGGVLLDLGDRTERYLPGQRRPIEVR